MAVREGTRDALLELMRFRHFTRYYYDISYDWDRLDFLMRKFAQVRPMIGEDMDILENLSLSVSSELQKVEGLQNIKDSIKKQ